VKQVSETELEIQKIMQQIVNEPVTILPKAWQKHITYPNKRPHWEAMELLSHLVTWEKVDNGEGEISWRMRLSSEIDRPSYLEMSRETGLTVSQVRYAKKRLEQLGLVEFTGLTLKFNVAEIERISQSSKL